MTETPVLRLLSLTDLHAALAARGADVELVPEEDLLVLSRRGSAPVLVSWPQRAPFVRLLVDTGVAVPDDQADELPALIAKINRESDVAGILLSAECSVMFRSHAVVGDDQGVDVATFLRAARLLLADIDAFMPLVRETFAPAPSAAIGDPSPWESAYKE